MGRDDTRRVGFRCREDLDAMNDSRPDLVRSKREDPARRGRGVLASRTVQASVDDRATAFAALLERGLDTQYRLAAVILGDAVEAEDAVHDAAVIAWRDFASLRDRDRFEAWFGRILVNGCRDRLRARRRRPTVVPIPTDDEPGVGLTSVSIAGVADRDLLARAFVALDPDHAIVVVLRFYADLTVPEIADRLGIAEGTVKSRLHHALRRLRVAVASAEETDR
jgi:RNA polymerase sigma-70 factor (ECF subfamily)